MLIDILKSKIADEAATIADLKRQLELAEARKFALEDVLAVADSDNASLQLTDSALPATKATRADRNDSTPSQNESRTSFRQISTLWQDVLKFIGSKNGIPVNIDQIAGFAEQQGVSLTRNNIRSQASNLTKRGYLERPEAGHFVLTPLGAEMCGFKNAEEDDGSSSSSSIQRQSPLNDAVGQQPHAEGNDSARRD